MKLFVLSMLVLGGATCLLATEPAYTINTHKLPPAEPVRKHAPERDFHRNGGIVMVVQARSIGAYGPGTRRIPAHLHVLDTRRPACRPHYRVSLLASAHAKRPPQATDCRSPCSRRRCNGCRSVRKPCADSSPHQTLSRRDRGCERRYKEDTVQAGKSSIATGKFMTFGVCLHTLGVSVWP